MPLLLPDSISLPLLRKSMIEEVLWWKRHEEQSRCVIAMIYRYQIESAAAHALYS